MSLSQIELVWVRVLCKMAESKMAEFKIVAIINLSENAWVKFFCVNGWITDGRIQDGCHHQVESKWTSEVFLCKMADSKMAEFKMAAIINLSENAWVNFFLCKWLNPRWQNSRWLPSWSWVRINKWSFFVQNGWIQDDRIQDGCHHLVSRIELVWVRVRVEG